MNHSPPRQSKQLTGPDSNWTKVSDTAAKQAEIDAAAHGQSSVTPFPPSDPAPEQTPVVPKPVIPAAFGQTTEIDYHLPAQSPPPSPPSSPQLNKARLVAYKQQIDAMLTAFAGGPASTDVLVKATPREVADPMTASADPHAADPRAGAARPDPMAARLLAKVLIPAGRGVYARTIVGVSSDQPGPIVAVAESGPIAGDRMIGSFTRQNNLLVVQMNSITLADGEQRRIDALMVAPDTMQTAVASGVDEHYLTRFGLPVAAAFVAGFGQATAQSNSIVQSSPLGGLTAYNNLNLGQQMGVAAGAAGQTASRLIAQAAPQGPTISLATGVDVGVIFLKPLKAPQ